MSTAFERPLVAELRHGLDALRGNWFWFVLLGIALIVLGFIALGSVVMASLATAVFIGMLIFLGGITESRRRSGVGPGAGSSYTCSPACYRSSSESCFCGRRWTPCLR